MKSSTPKVLHEIGGRTLIEHLLESIEPLELSRVIAVVGYKEKLVKDSLSGREVDFALQEEQRGTAHALQQAKGKIESDSFLVVPGDLPLVKPSSLKEFVKFGAKNKDQIISLLTVRREDPGGYGRIKRDEAGNVKEIVEEKDATEEEKKIKEVNAGIYFLENREELWRELNSIDSANAQGEFYLTDLAKRFSGRQEGVGAFKMENPEEFLGVNTRKHLSFAGKVLNRRKMNSLFDSGVTVIDPESTIVESQVEIGRDTVIGPFTTIRGDTTIGPKSRIGPNVEIIDGRIGTEVEISHAVVKDTMVRDNRTVDPFNFLGSD